MPSIRTTFFLELYYSSQEKLNSVLYESLIESMWFYRDTESINNQSMFLVIGFNIYCGRGGNSMCV